MCDDRVARLVVLLLGDPPLLAGGERGEDDAADPHGRYLRSGRAMILTFMEAGASAVSSLQKRVYDLLRAFRERPAALGFRKSLVGSPQSSNRLHQGWTIPPDMRSIWYKILYYVLISIILSSFLGFYKLSIYPQYVQ